MLQHPDPPVYQCISDRCAKGGEKEDLEHMPETIKHCEHYRCPRCGLLYSVEEVEKR